MSDKKNTGRYFIKLIVDGKATVTLGPFRQRPAAEAQLYRLQMLKGYEPELIDIKAPE